jgi:hypothetical protein
LAARKIAKRKGPKRVVRRSKPPERERPAPAETPSAADRPRYYSDEVANAFLDRLAAGESATQICRDYSMPTWCVLKRWERDNDDFARRYEIARKQCCEYRTDEIAEIADNAVNDYVERVTRKGVIRVFDREHFERSKLRVMARQWEAQKVLRHVYGEKAEVELRTPGGINVKVEERNALIDALCKLVHPKADGKTRPDKHDEPRER